MSRERTYLVRYSCRVITVDFSSTQDLIYSSDQSNVSVRPV